MSQLFRDHLGRANLRKDALLERLQPLFPEARRLADAAVDALPAPVWVSHLSVDDYRTLAGELEVPTRMRVGTRLWLGDYYRTYPTTVEAEVTAVLASTRDFERGPRFTVLRDSPNHLARGFTVRDGNYLSGRWPGDCHRLAAEYTDLVLAHSRS
mgnify:CR=1 FL=1